MKQKLLCVLGIPGVALVFALAFAGCDDGTKAGGTDILTAPNLTALNAKIAEAELAKDGVQTESDAANVAQGRKWVTADVMNTFNAAIDTAKNARSSATQAEVIAATSALDAAIAVFNNAKQNGSKTSGFTQQELSALINDANSVKDGVQTSANGNDVSPQTYWVTQSEMNALNSAISSAQGVSGGNIDSVYNALVTAMNTFIAAKKPGTGKSPRTLTITGLNVDDGTVIFVGLFESDQINLNEEPEIGVDGEIQNRTATLTLYNSSNNTPWTGSGSYYVGFQMEGKIYISRSKITFSDANPGQTIAFSNSSFKPYVFKYTLGEFAEEMGIEIPPEGITLDDWVSLMSDGMTYTDMLANGYIPGPLYKDEALTQPFSGSDKLFANTPIYSEFNLMGGDGPEPGTQIGVITGTITLTDVPSPAPQVYISVQGSDNNGNNSWWSRGNRITFSGSGTVSNISWSIPIYDNDGFFASTGNFRLYVRPSGSNREFEVRIPTTSTISSANQSGINLGSVSIKTMTLSGTINLTINGKPVPYVEIALDTTDGQFWIASTELNSPGANAPWSITLPAIDATVYLRVAGYQNRNDNNRIFYRELKDENQLITVSGESKSGVTINLGNIQTVTLSGTITVTYNGQPVPNVQINAYAYNSGSSWTQLSSPAANAPWSMTMEAPASQQNEEVNFYVMGWDRNGNNLFYKEITLSSPVQISNQNISNITLNLGNITD